MPLKMLGYDDGSIPKKKGGHPPDFFNPFLAVERTYFRIVNAWFINAVCLHSVEVCKV